MTNPIRRGIIGLMCVVVGATAVSAGCGPTVISAFRDKGFSSEYGYQVRYAAGRQLMPPRWGLDNYVEKDGKWVPAEEPGYLTTYTFDDDGDGRIDTRFERLTYALRFEHKASAGLIWLRNIPVPHRLRDTDLRLWLLHYVDQIAGAQSRRIGLEESSNAELEILEAAMIVDQGPVTVAGQPGYAATVDFGNIGEHKLAPGARGRRVRIVVMYAPRMELSDDAQDRVRQRTFRNDATAPLKQYAVLAVAGYSNVPTDFQAGLPDFNDFLGRITIDGTSGISPAASAPPPLAAPASTPAPVADPPASAPAPLAAPASPPAPTATPPAPPAPAAPTPDR